MSRLFAPSADHSDHLDRVSRARLLDGLQAMGAELHHRFGHSDPRRQMGRPAVHDGRLVFLGMVLDPVGIMLITLPVFPWSTPMALIKFGSASCSW